jgi:hypothetical protein
MPPQSERPRLALGIFVVRCVALAIVIAVAIGLSLTLLE